VDACRRRAVGVEVANLTDTARARILAGSFDAIIILETGGPASSIAFLRDLRSRGLRQPVLVVMRGPRAEEVAKVMRAGADEIVDAPYDPDQVLDAVETLLRVYRAASGRTEGRGGAARPLIVGSSPCLECVLAVVERVAKTRNTTVLIQGESGTGKELIARAIHHDGARRDRPFMAINCAALNESILEAEIFGYEKGAFTGANASGKKGLFEAADGGTLFLDEIGEMTQGLQAKLLRVLQENSFKRVGGVADVRVDVRIIASTNRDLRDEVRKGTFRSDLFFRLNVMPIRVPPLRERKEDIPEVAGHFLSRFAAEMGKRVSGFSTEALRLLTNHSWPGNIRELRNVCEYAVIVCDGEYVEPRHLSIAEAEPAGGGDVLALKDRSIRTMEQELIKVVLAETRFNISRAARTLGINRSTLYNKMRDLGFSRSEEEPVRMQG
jgi:two-component system response regulator AtoC